MRITRVDVLDWRILKKPQAEFRTNCAVIIGENGIGKSTLIELILCIFGLVFKRLKDSKAIADIDGFYLEYVTTDASGNNHQVVFESGYLDGSKTGDLRVIIDESEYNINEDGGQKLKSLLPANIICYYAGGTERVMNLCNSFIMENVDAVRKSGNPYTLVPLNLPADAPFIYSDMFHLPIALVSLLVSDIRGYTLGKLSLKAETVNVIVRLKKPAWGTGKSEDFWGNSSHLFNDFLSGLIDHGIVKEQSQSLIEIEISAMSLRDYLDELGIAHKGMFLFQLFDLLNNNDLLKDVDVKWLRNGKEFNSTPISIDYFSEGEKQIIMTSALIEFWDKEHCLFLFDEPDTFLHPKWQSRFLPELMENIKDSQAIITTHSPLMLSSVHGECELFVMKEGQLMAYSGRTYGMKAGDIIETAMETSSRDNRVASLLQEIENLILDGRIDNAKSKLVELENTGVSPYDFNRLRSTIEKFELLGI